MPGEMSYKERGFLDASWSHHVCVERLREDSRRFKRLKFHPPVKSMSLCFYSDQALGFK